MSISSLLTAIENDVAAFSPAAFVKAVHIEIEALKAAATAVKADVATMAGDLTEMQSLAVDAESILGVAYPSSAAIPATVAAFISKLQTLAAKVQAKQAASKVAVKNEQANG